MSAKTCAFQSRLVKCRDRWGLWYVDDVINIFIKTEKNFKLETRNFTQKIDFEKIVINVDPGSFFCKRSSTKAQTEV